MKNSRFFMIVLLLPAIVLFAAATAMAGGLYINEFATPSMGAAGAGAEAWAVDASTAFHNPAGMTRLEESQIMMGSGILISSINSDLRDDPADAFTITGGDGGDAGTFSPLLTTYWVKKLSEQWSLGLNVLSISGSLIDYDDSWVGRFQAQDVSLLTVTVNPSLGYRVNDWLSVGAGVGLIVARLEMDLAIPQLLTPPDPTSGGEGQASLDGEDTETLFNLGALFEVSDRTRIGWVYWSEVEPTFSGDLSVFPQASTVSIDTTFPLAQWSRVALYHELSEKVALVSTVAWEDWSALKNYNITADPTGSTVSLARNWKDVWKYAIGAHIRLSDDLLFLTGAAYDTAPMDKEDRSADLPVDRQIRLATGLQYRYAQGVTVGGSVLYADLGDAEIQKRGITGDYDENSLLALGFNINLEL